VWRQAAFAVLIPSPIWVEASVSAVEGNIMTKILVALTALLLASPALALEPIPGSITYGGGPHSKLQRSPIGSTLVHRFHDGVNEYEERYIVQQDRSLKLISRSRRNDR
jgi:hypothetical protein